jgi:glutamyl-tRNA synthetase
MKIKAADLIHPTRVALTGKTVGPPLFDVIAVLGRDLTIKRLKEFTSLIP